MADGDGEGVGGIGRFGNLRQVKQAGDHELDLLFFGEAIADDAGLDFERRVLGDGQLLACGCEECDAARASIAL